MDTSHTGSLQDPDKNAGSEPRSANSSEKSTTPSSRRHLRVLDARPEPAPRGAAALRALERPWLAIDRLLLRMVAPEWNPLGQSGAIANTTFLVAVVSGILLLFWYVPSVHQAYDSLEGMRELSVVLLVRSLHRYSSDACLLFIVLHALRYFTAARFGGPRWLAWVTGVFALGGMWLVGWLGYWLVWDERGEQVALGTARMLDVLPIFVDPLSRSFLTDEGINSLLFFIVFFAHMLLPLVVVVALWLHITRLSRPMFLTGRGMTLWVLGSLTLLSILHPATSAAPARMLTPPLAFSMDYYYLLPLVLTDRLGGGALWAVTLLLGAVGFSVPWMLRRGRAEPAHVEPARCNACETCFRDCPYGAIDMVPRNDGRDYPTQALVNPSKCVGCGVCAGSCDSAGIGLPQLSVPEMRHKMDAWLDATRASGDESFVAFVCASSAGERLHMDSQTGVCEQLPGYRVWATPCAGWVHALTVQRAFRHGAQGVLVVACSEGQCEYRQGADITVARLAGERKPALALDKLAGGRVHTLRLPRGAQQELWEHAARFRQGALHTPPPKSRQTQVAWGFCVALIFGALTAAASDAPYALPNSGGPELVISFSHPGRSTEHCRTLSEQDKLKLPVHMRRNEICDRSRADVRLRVTVDGHVLYEHAHPPSGVYGDMNSIAAVHVPIAPGRHRLQVALGDTHDPSEWSYQSASELDFAKHGRHVIVFDRTRGFRWY